MESESHGCRVLRALRGGSTPVQGEPASWEHGRPAAHDGLAGPLPIAFIPRERGRRQVSSKGLSETHTESRTRDSSLRQDEKALQTIRGTLSSLARAHEGGTRTWAYLAKPLENGVAPPAELLRRLQEILRALKCSPLSRTGPIVSWRARLRMNSLGRGPKAARDYPQAPAQALVRQHFA
jgi:hypothetical protein